MVTLFSGRIATVKSIRGGSSSLLSVEELESGPSPILGVRGLHLETPKPDPRIICARGRRVKDMSNPL